MVKKEAAKTEVPAAKKKDVKVVKETPAVKTPAKPVKK